MTTASAHVPTHSIVRTAPRAGQLVLNGLAGGLLASIAMAMVMMVLGAFDRGAFAAPSAIWAYFAGPNAYTPHSFSIPFVIGAMGHMMNSAVLGVVFAFIAGRLLRPRRLLSAAMLGTLFALLVLTVMWNVVLPLSPNGDIVRESAALWIWVLGHVAYGMAAGALYHLRSN